MCGIAAIFAHKENAPPVDRDELIAVRDQMIHRGPDGEGLWISDDRRIGLAHRRLTIVDLTDAGLQPMWSSDGACCVTYNGEIYNFPELREQLAASGRRFISNCDTEVLLHLYAEKGAEMVHALRGMYAFAIWDARQRLLFCARDPFGIKPIYYADDGRTIRVASQVKALLTSARVNTAPEPAGHVGFFLWGAIPDPFTLYRGVRALPAGHTLTVREGGAVQLKSFCSIPGILREAELDGPGTPGQNERDALNDALRDSAEHHLMADVPVGIFLSAGLDSSTLTALVSERHHDVRTVTLGFNEYRGSDQDETRLAEVVARAYKTNHQTIWITRRDFEAEASRLFDSMDRPTIDGVNTYFVSLAARRTGLKVAFSGLGGDELFGGYPSFVDVPRMARMARPFRGLSALGRSFRVVTAATIKKFTSPKFAGIFEYGSTFAGAYLLRRGLFMPWELPKLLEPDLVREGWADLNTIGELAEITDHIQSPHARVSAMELCWYMRHQLLRDSDWAGMGHSLEIRVPLVDVPLFRKIAPSLVSATPPTKRDMALSPRSALPEPILARPKTGFTVPVRDWLLRVFDPQEARERGLRGWAREVYSRFADPLDMHRLTMRSRGRRRSSKNATSETKPHLRALMLLTDGFGGFGGIAKFNRDFLTALCAHPQIAEVIALPRLMPRDPGPLPAKLRLVRDGLRGKSSFVTAAFRTAMELRRARAKGESIVLFCGHINYVRIAAAARRICGASSHLIIHGIDAWRPPQDPLARPAIKELDGFISVSGVTKQRFLSWSGLRFDQGLILPNCVDLAEFAPGSRSAELMKCYGLQGRKILLTLGRLASAERYKGFDETIEVLPRLAQQFPGIAYLVCGDGRDRPRLVEKARLLHCDVFDSAADAPRQNQANDGQSTRPLVVFTGRISEAEKADHYRLADAYVMPSSGEGFGIVYLEALACGIPVIGSKVDGSREALREGRLGTLVDPNDPEEIYDAIVHALTEQTGSRNLERRDLEYFSIERFNQRVHAIVNAIAASRSEADHGATNADDRNRGDVGSRPLAERV